MDDVAQGPRTTCVCAMQCQSALLGMFNMPLKSRFFIKVHSRYKRYLLRLISVRVFNFSIKDLKTREYFEKVFPEIKKSREDKERITRYSEVFTSLIIDSINSHLTALNAKKTTSRC